jgi:flavodoxin
MKTAVIVYRSRTGVTRRFANEIGEYLGVRGIETQVTSVGECDPAILAAADFVLLGCWTTGLLVIRQHPDQPWIDFARDVPALAGPRVGLFTTYKLATGSMFAKMREHLGDRVGSIALELKSRDGRLSDGHRRALDRFVWER